MKINMFLDRHGKLIFFPCHTARPAHGIYELADHLRNEHKELYKFLSLADEKSKVILEQYEITALA